MSACTYPDAVAALPNDRMVISSLWNPQDPERLAKLRAGAPVGSLFEWSPRTGIRELEETKALSGPNGVIASPDGKFVFVAVWSGKAVARIDLAGLSPRSTKPPQCAVPDRQPRPEDAHADANYSCHHVRGNGTGNRSHQGQRKLLDIDSSRRSYRHRSGGQVITRICALADGIDVRFTPESGHRLVVTECPLSTISGHMQRSN